MAPKRLWDECLELESYIKSNSAYDVYKLVVEVPKKIMSREISDNLNFLNG